MKRLVAILTLIVTNLTAPAVEKSIPVIEFSNFEFQRVLESLAREMGQTNVIIDPHVSGSNMTARWENLTARQVLEKLMSEQGLTMVTNPATTVARIAPTNLMVKPVPSNRVGSDTNGIIPQLRMFYVPLGKAITNIANQAGLGVTLDPKLSERPFKYLTVEVEWRNITASQALAALLDNYDLVLEKGVTNSPARVLVNSREDSTPEKQR